MPLFNSILARILPLLPKWAARPFASPYVAGTTPSSALKVVRELNSAGFSATLDILGEHVESAAQARGVRDAYLELYEFIHHQGLDCNISLKLTHLGLGLSGSPAKENLLDLAGKARERDNFLRIDMENSDYTDETIALYRKCRELQEPTGMVLQACLRRTLSDIEELSGPGFNCRICKGIYPEPEELSFTLANEIRENFSLAVRAILSKGGYAAIATHDIELINSLENWIMENEVAPHRFEFQVLHGVPMAGRLERLRKRGYKVRVYVPFGEDWFDYSIRRLRENPRILGYVIKNIFSRRRKAAAQQKVPARRQPDGTVPA
ncbi:MAG: proline dehydrogenase family protein [Planctomycetota bacterium]|nr:proline dehydrogenase family protein [Planctomycetota bacterium]